MDEPVERVRHRALAHPAPDTELAEELSDAAATARQDGAWGMAAQLSTLAAERTPNDPERTADRHCSAAADAYAAGLVDLASSSCQAALRIGNRATRVRARLLLIRVVGQDDRGVDALLAGAEADADDTPGLAALVHRSRAEQLIFEGHLSAGLATAEVAEGLAAAAGDTQTCLDLIALRAPLMLQSDPGVALALLDRGMHLAAGQELSEASVYIRLAWTVARLRWGEVTDAVAEIERLRREVEHAGRTRDLSTVLYIATSVYERAGRCADCYAVGRLGSQRIGELDPAGGSGLVLRAVAELNGGTVEDAERLLRAGVTACESAHELEWTAYANGLLGRAQPAQALRGLARCRELLAGLGYHDPAQFLVDADLAEAQITTGEVAAALDTIADARQRAHRLGRSVVELGLRRAEVSTWSQPAAAADALRSDPPETHPYPLEVARVWLTIATLERRARREAAARAALQRAIEEFDRYGCLPWLRFAKSQLASLDAPDGASADVDRLVLARIRAGDSNREIARTLHLSVKSVEARLTRLYRRMDVQNRAELARAVAPTADSAP